VIYIYTDASFNKANEFAVTGFVYYHSTVEHESIPASKMEIKFCTLSESNNIRAEIQGAIDALQSCPEGSQVTLFTDCQTVCDLPRRRKKLEQTNYISKTNGTRLANADLYDIFFKLTDRVQLDIHWLKGHSPKLGLSQIQQNFSHLDKKVRSLLRREVYRHPTEQS